MSIQSHRKKNRRQFSSVYIGYLTAPSFVPTVRTTLTMASMKLVSMLTTVLLLPSVALAVILDSQATEVADRCMTGFNLDKPDDPACVQVHAAYVSRFGKIIRTEVELDDPQLLALIAANRNRTESAGLQERDCICTYHRESWYDPDYTTAPWFHDWRQVGDCKYCDSCSQGISVSATVTQAWTAGLGVTLDAVLQGVFQFQWVGFLVFLRSTLCILWAVLMQDVTLAGQTVRRH